MYLGIHFILVVRVFVPFYFIFEFFFLQLVIRVCTLCFESRPYCLVILHDVLSFHLVILLFS